MLKQFLLNLFFPLECLGCRNEGFLLCENCFRQLKFSPDDQTKYLKTPDIDKVFIAGDYEDLLLAKLIKKFKYDFIIDLGQLLARFLITFWRGQNYYLKKNNFNPLLVPIPLSRRREKWRGFNQSRILAEELSNYFIYPLDLSLKRIRHRAPQAELNEKKRLENIQGIFAWTGENLNGKDIILVDDVVTSGATLNEAARVLKANGATSIYALVLAKG